MYIYPVVSSQNTTPGFGKFVKVKGSAQDLQNFRDELYEVSKDFVSIMQKKSETKSFLYVISGKDADKFLDLAASLGGFMELRRKPQAYLKKKPKVMNVIDAFEKLKEDKKVFF